MALRVGWENILLVGMSARRDAEGRRLSEVAAARGREPADTLLDLLVEEGGRGGVILFQMDEGDVRRALAHPAVMVGSDGSSLAPTGPMAASKPHPRSYGTFPRVLGEYARQQRTISLPQAVHKMTGLPARRLGLRDRGTIRVGARADLVVFDAKQVIDVATYDEPHRYPAGIEHVLVNGSFVIRDGVHTGSLPGRVLRHP
jgi:N-acyl-D-amino-acid deacylase